MKTLQRPLSSPKEGDGKKSVRIREIAERHLLYDMAETMSRVKSDKVDAVVIGGMAVRAYTGPVRYTSDVDLAVTEQSLAKLRRILKDLKYRCRELPFSDSRVMFAKKHVEERAQGIAYNLEFDVSIGSIADFSTGERHVITPRFLAESRERLVSGFFPGSASVMVSTRVAGVEDLFIMKTLTRMHPGNGREKDIHDALLLAVLNPPDVEKVCRIAGEQGCMERLQTQIVDKLLAYIDSKKNEVVFPYGLEYNEMRARQMMRAVLRNILAQSS